MHAADRSIADDFAVTADAVFALIADALAAESPEEAARLRSAARAQLAVCGMLSSHVRRALACEPAAVDVLKSVGPPT